MKKSKQCPAVWLKFILILICFAITSCVRSNDSQIIPVTKTETFPDTDTSTSTPTPIEFSVYISPDTSFLEVSFKYPSNWQWTRAGDPTGRFEALTMNNPVRRPEIEDFGGISLMVVPIEINSSFAEFSIKTCLSDVPSPENVVPTITLVDDKTVLIDNFPARWITIKNDAYWPNEVNNFLECIVIQTKLNTISITAHIPEIELDEAFGKGFYHMIETLDLTP